MMMRCKGAGASQSNFDASAENWDQYETTIEACDELYTVERRRVNMITKALSRLLVVNKVQIHRQGERDSRRARTGHNEPHPAAAGENPPTGEY
jgi:phosphoketolase